MKSHLKRILTLSKSFWSAAEMLTVPGEAMPAALSFSQLKPFWQLVAALEKAANVKQM